VHDAEDDATAGAPDVSGAAGPAQHSGGGEDGGDGTLGALSDLPGADAVVAVGSPVRDVQRRDMLQECRKKEDFEILKQVGAGTFGLVSKCDSILLPSNLYGSRLPLCACCALGSLQT
jgi:hypothetical protein